MQFRDLKTQYSNLKSQMDQEIAKVLSDANFISGKQVRELEERLAEYTGRKHCITCGNGTDALTLALMAWGIGEHDAVFVPDFTFFASGEAPAGVGAVPVFVDVDERTFNMSPESLQSAIEQTIRNGRLTPKAIIAVDLFGQPAEYDKIETIAKEYGLLLLEDAAQGFGGDIRGRKTCSFGDISATSFFPAKPLGCYGDGGAVFTDNDEWAELVRSYTVHGKGADKYDNVRIGMNSRLDTLQAAVLLVKLKAFEQYELADINTAAQIYSRGLQDLVRVPYVKEGFYSSWAQYSILLENTACRDGLKKHLQGADIPAMIYYQKPMHSQKAFEGMECQVTDLSVAEEVCSRILSLPIHPYIKEEKIKAVTEEIQNYLG